MLDGLLFHICNTLIYGLALIRDGYGDRPPGLRTAAIFAVFVPEVDVFVVVVVYPVAEEVDRRGRKDCAGEGNGPFLRVEPCFVGTVFRSE